jgi:DNA replication and repair protein RecF
MVVKRLRVLDFRNLASAEIPLGDAVTLVFGPNGAGKTNLLEALYLGLAGRSPRATRDREAIAFGAPLTRVEVDLEGDDGARTFTCSVARDGQRRHLIDGGEVGPEHVEARPALALFAPDRLALVKGPPSGRRRHLDAFCAALRPGDVGARRRFARALAQRNALLARVRSGAAGPQALAGWDGELAVAAVDLMGRRAAALARLRQPFLDAAAELGLGGRAELRYAPRSPASSPEEIIDELVRRRELDLRRGHTTHGPHLDEVSLELDDRPLRAYGSQGQQRLAVLALLFAERQVLLEERRTPPLLLLDDVTSELDRRRRELLCRRLDDGGGQALITATAAGELPAGAPRLELGLRAGRALAPVEARDQAA